MCHLDRNEWDFRSRFDAITDGRPGRESMDEIECCEFWEYARESPTLRDLNESWESISKEIPSALHNCYFPLLNAAYSPFPNKPWLSLTDQERRDFQSQFFRKGVIPLPSLDIAEGRIATIKRDIPRNRRNGYVFFAIDPSAWKHFTDKELGKLVSASISRWRPETTGEPADPQIGRAYGDTLARLRWLAAMRLYSRFPFSDLKQFLTDLGVAGSWIENDGKLLRDPWKRARRDAKDRFRRLFPFLEARNEEPLSYPTYRNRTKSR